MVLHLNNHWNNENIEYYRFHKLIAASKNLKHLILAVTATSKNHNDLTPGNRGNWILTLVISMQLATEIQKQNCFEYTIDVIK